jgi:hypothetical protein
MKSGLTVKININNKYTYGITTGITWASNPFKVLEVEPTKDKFDLDEVDICREADQVKLTTDKIQIFRNGIESNFLIKDKVAFIHNNFG